MESSCTLSPPISNPHIAYRSCRNRCLCSTSTTDHCFMHNCNSSPLQPLPRARFSPLHALVAACSLALLLPFIIDPQSPFPPLPTFLSSLTSATPGPQQQPARPSPPTHFTIQGAVFPINNSLVHASLPVGSPGLQIVFVGVVLDVRSASVFYGQGQGCVRARA